MYIRLFLHLVQSLYTTPIVLTVPVCNYAEVTWEASTFISETIHNHIAIYQCVAGSAVVHEGPVDNLNERQ